MKDIAMKSTIVAGIALAESSVHQRAEPVTIRVGWSSANASIVPVGLAKKDLMPHYGKSYVVEDVHFAGSPAVITGLGTNGVDFGQLAYSSFAFAIENAKMTDLRIVSDVVPRWRRQSLQRQIRRPQR